MPDIHGQYSLREAAQKIEVSTAWINKVQSKTGIPRPVSTKGEEVRFSEKDFLEIEAVYGLRLLNCSFEEIKEIYSLEKDLASYAKYIDLLDQTKAIEGPCCIIYVEKGPMSLFLNPPIINPSMLGKKIKTEELEKYIKMLKSIVKAYSEINRRANNAQKSITKIAEKASKAEKELFYAK